MKPKLRFYADAEIRKDENTRTVTFVASDSTRDSAHTVLNQNGWDLKRFNKNGIIGYQHNVYGSDNPDNVIGKGQAFVENGKLMVRVEFEPAEINPLAEKVYQKVLFGTLKAVSVGFLPKGVGYWGKGDEAVGEKNETYYFKGQELLEVSIVNIPANPNALKRQLEEEEEELTELRALPVEDSEEPVDESTEVTSEESAQAPDPESIEEPDTRSDEDLEAEAEKERLLTEARAAVLINQ